MESMMDQKFSSREIYAWRMAASVFWSIVFQFFFLLAYIFIIQIDMFHPYSSVTKWFGIVTSLSVWLNIFPLTVVIFAQGIVCSKDYMNGPLRCTTRFSMLRSILSWKNLFMGSLHIFIGLMIALIYTSFGGEDLKSFTTVCTTDTNQGFTYLCFSEKRFFLVFGGFWIGLYYFLCDYIFGTRNLIFPPIQQLKFIQVKTTFLQNIKQAMWDAIFPSVFFLVIYYFRGGCIRTWYSNLLSANLNTEPLDSVFGLLNASIILYLWLFSSIFVVTLRLMQVLFNIHLTEYSMFPISTSLHSQSAFINLKEGLGMSSLPIIQHLSFLDLYVLSEKDQRRREELFAISQPGGHPHNWNGILEECLKIISTFTKDLETLSIEPMKEETLKSKSLVSDNNLSHSHICNKNLRSLAATSVYDFDNNLPRSNIQLHIDELGKKVQYWVNAKRSAFLKKPIVLYFVGELPEKKLRCLLYQSQPIIWASQSLSLLACASLTEDNYGVVQNSLGDIINALLKLKQTLEKVPKQFSTGSVKKSQASELFDIQMRIALKSAVKRSIYKISITFCDYIKDIGLTPEAQQQLLGFIACREV